MASLALVHRSDLFFKSPRRGWRASWPAAFTFTGVAVKCRPADASDKRLFSYVYFLSLFSAEICRLRYCGNLPTDWRNPECGSGYQNGKSRDARAVLSIIL